MIFFYAIIKQITLQISSISALELHAHALFLKRKTVPAGHFQFAVLAEHLRLRFIEREICRHNRPLNAEGIHVFKIRFVIHRQAQNRKAVSFIQNIIKRGNPACKGAIFLCHRSNNCRFFQSDRMRIDFRRERRQTSIQCIIDGALRFQAHIKKGHIVVDAGRLQCHSLCGYSPLSSPILCAGTWLRKIEEVILPAHSPGAPFNRNRI